MKPFDLEKFKAGAVGITRCGEEVTFVAHVPKAQENYRLVFMDHLGCIEQCAETGRYLGHMETDLDIIGLKQETKTYWINMYEGSCYGYESKENADQVSFVNNKRINNKAYKVEIEL